MTMSLLMQALKKAERAKQNHVPDEGLAKPSEAFDEVLELAPQEALPLSPLDASMPESAAEPAAPPPRHRSPRNTVPPPVPRAKVRKRAMARMDARTIRIAILSSIALLIGAVFAYMYWHAVYGPGSSRHLPMVPMPGQHLPPAVAPALLAALPSAPLEPVIAQPSIADAPPPSSREPLRPDDYMRAEQAAPAPAPAPRRAAPVVSPDNDAIRVARVSKPAQVSPSLQNGFNAYNRGDLSAARQNYQSALRQDANSRDALLGMAALAISDKQPEQAAALYARLLDIDPNDNDALAGLTSLRQGDPAQTESRLKRVLERNPESGSLLFSLGNLYARQGRWPEAQQHYFRAYTSTPNNADYAFNLAVGLDRLNQGKLALSYYQRALELAPRGAVHFDREAAATRARELGGQ